MLIAIIYCFLKRILLYSIHEPVSVCTLFDFICSLTDKHKLLYFAVKGLYPLIILRLLIISTANEKCRSVHGTYTLNGCIRIGAL